MSGIRSRHTKPERVVRSGLHKLGFRFSLHGRKLPGTPDLVLPKYNALIFVHGCFWHGHDCRFFKMPGTRIEFWKNKFARNKANDERARNRLVKEGWRVATVWECALRDRPAHEIEKIIGRVGLWLKSSRRSLELRAPQRKAA